MCVCICAYVCVCWVTTTCGRRHLESHATRIPSGDPSLAATPCLPLVAGKLRIEAPLAGRDLGTAASSIFLFCGFFRAELLRGGE